MNTTCNSTLEDLRILPTSEITIVGPLTFHDLALIIAGASTIVAITMSFFLIFQHALHYTKPREQKHIIRILLMVPIYASASFLSIKFYWHAIYFEVISDCYEAFAISSFFALLCHYVAPDLHEQKEFFRRLNPVKPWVWPLSWFKMCCGGDTGAWRTPKSGLTWFNIIWIGIYHYCFIRVAMTITAVVTQHFSRYCESSNSPVFGHIWIIVVNSIAVTIAMYCVIQFYVQLRVALADHSPFLKVLAIKLVIFLSFWQSAAISVGTSTLNIVHPNSVLAYPDIKVGIPSLLLCFEMACFAILHLWAFPWRPYRPGAQETYYPNPTSGGSSGTVKLNVHEAKSAGGPLGLRALLDAMNIWDVIKAFGRGVRWLFVGVKHRHDDASYQTATDKVEMDMDELSPTGRGRNNAVGKSTDHLPIATEFRRSKFDLMYGPQPDTPGHQPGRVPSDEAAGLIEHAQPMSNAQRMESNPYQYRYDAPHQPYRDPDEEPEEYPQEHQQYFQQQQQRQKLQQRQQEQPGDQQAQPEDQQQRPQQERLRPNSVQVRVNEALWGSREEQGLPR